jgi:hypothetical protein
MRGEGVQGDVGDDSEIRHRVLQGAHRALGQSVRVECLFRVERLDFHGGHREECHGWDAEPLDLDRVLNENIDAEPLDPGHGGHRLALPRAVEHKDRVDEVVRCQVSLAHHATREVVAAHTTQAGHGEGGTMGVTIGHGLASGSDSARPGPPRRSSRIQ